MKLVYIAQVDIGRDNGPGINEREFVHVMRAESARRGDQAHFILPEPSRPFEDMADACHFYPCSRADKRLGRLLRGRRRARQVMDILSANGGELLGADLFVIRPHVDLLLAAQRLRQLGKVIVYKTLEDLGSLYYKKKWPWRKKLLYRFITARKLAALLPAAKAIDCCTEQYKSAYQKLLGLNNIHVIPNSVNTAKFQPADRAALRQELDLPFDPVIGYAGGEPSQRGASSMANAAAAILERFPNAGFVVIGVDADLPGIQRLVAERGFEQRFRFLGKVPYDQLWKHINGFDIGVALDDPDRLAIIGNSSQKIRQYIACGVPFLCGHKTNGDLVQAGFGREVDIKSDAAFASTVLQMLDEGRARDPIRRLASHEYAKKELSYERAYEDRYRLWTRDFP